MHEPASEMHRVHFTGSGREYFKIWIVNLLLGILTFGMYAPWARLRRLQYFHRNTQLAGTAFDFDGKPWTAFRNRLLVLAMLGACVAAFHFSTGAGTALFLASLLLVPFLLREALRWRVEGVRYRGAQPGFTGSLGGAYAAWLPPLAIFLVPAAIAVAEPPIAILLAVIPYWLGWPLMRRAIKRYQHGHLQWGARAANFGVSRRRFYLPYLQMIALLFLALANAYAILVLATVVSSKLGGSIYEASLRSHATLSAGLLAAFIIYLFAGPGLQVWTGNLAWSATTLPGIRIASDMRPGAWLRLQLINAILTLLSLGLYRPFAVVRAYRHRMEHITVGIDGALPSAPAAARKDHAGSMVDRLYRHWYAALLALLLLAAAAAGLVRWGMPALAGRVMATLPALADQQVGDAALRAMESSKQLWPPSGASETALAQVQDIFMTIKPVNARVPMRLLVRSVFPHEPNVFSLPNGTIVMSQDMFYGLEYPDARSREETRAAVAAVLAHEIGHLEGRHAMRAILDASPLALASAVLWGDFSKVAASDPLLLLKMRYSRAMETAADNYAVERMRQAGLPMAPLADLYDDLEQRVWRDEKEIPEWMAVKFTYLRSHPPSPERMARFRAERPPAAP